MYAHGPFNQMLGQLLAALGCSAIAFSCSSSTQVQLLVWFLAVKPSVAGAVHLEHHVILTPLLDQPGLRALIALDVCEAQGPVIACRDHMHRSSLCAHRLTCTTSHHRLPRGHTLLYLLNSLQFRSQVLVHCSHFLSIYSHRRALLESVFQGSYDLAIYSGSQQRTQSTESHQPA